MDEKVKAVLQRHVTLNRRVEEALGQAPGPERAAAVAPCLLTAVIRSGVSKEDWLRVAGKLYDKSAEFTLRYNLRIEPNPLTVLALEEIAQSDMS